MVNGNGEFGSKLDPKTKLGYVSLTISDLRRSVRFYQDSLGFQLLKEEGDTAYLGAGEDILLILVEQPGAIQYERRTGLYHFAILTPSRVELGNVLKNLIESNTQIQGGADHLVSEAIYLSDPDGNGIEIYRDRPRADWEYENGILKMATEPLDYQDILAEVDGKGKKWNGLDGETRLGHMHLHVADLTEAVDFYENTLGFDLQLYYGTSAAFLSAGGYHHHIGLNTWNGTGAPPPPPNSVGLRYFSVTLHNYDEMGQLVKRMEQAEASYEKNEDGLLVQDPLQNGILFVVSESI